jgi:opacity protein-like surface antigen
MKKFSIGAGLVALLALPGLAQAQAAPEPKLFLRPTVGAVVGSGPGASFSASISLKTTAKMQINGEFGSLTNILPNSVEEQVEVAAAQVANSVNGKHSASASADAGFVQVGMRYRLRDVSGAQTFLEVGVGVAHVTSDVDAVVRGSETIQGDISDAVATPFTSATPETKPLVTLGGGIVLPINRRMAVEIGLRYQQIFTTDTAIKMFNICGAYRIGF